MKNDSNVVNIEDYQDKQSPKKFDIELIEGEEIIFKASSPEHILECEHYINDLGGMSVRITESPK